jgi:hypothetical protein
MPSGWEISPREGKLGLREGNDSLAHGSGGLAEGRLVSWISSLAFGRPWFHGTGPGAMESVRGFQESINPSRPRTMTPQSPMME